MTNGIGSPAGMGGDVNFGYLWLEETLFTDGTIYCGFTINPKYLTRENSSETLVIGMDEIYWRLLFVIYNKLTDVSLFARIAA